jgi:hypothetical protein
MPDDPECVSCGEPIVGDPVVDPEQRRWLPPSAWSVFCSADCLADAGERAQCSA